MLVRLRQRVPYPPPSALVEIVPESPAADAVWIDGYWDLRGRTWVWERGGWVDPPPGAYACPWRARYRDDGVLLYARFLLPAATPPAPETAEPTTTPFSRP